MCDCGNCTCDKYEFLECEFRNCTREAEYEGWYRVLDFAGQPTGLIQKMMVCKDCTKYLIGNKKEES